MQNESFVIVLPLPPAILNPNCAISSIGGRFAKAAASKKQRRLACEAVLEANIMSIPWGRVKVRPVFACKTKRRRDTDNAIASLKSAYDGIVDSGLIEDDTPEFMERAEPAFVVDREYPRLELHIERIK
jgi:crossover junction endodeoxyribonuclease RusA